MAEEKSTGFEISFDPMNTILRVRAWGFWDAEFVKKYGSAFTQKIEELWEDGQKWCMLLDLTGFYPQSENVYHRLSQYITNATERGMQKIAYLGERSVVQLQLKRVDDMRQYASAESEEEAIQWLLKSKERSR